VPTKSQKTSLKVNSVPAKQIATKSPAKSASRKTSKPNTLDEKFNIPAGPAKLLNQDNTKTNLIVSTGQRKYFTVAEDFRILQILDKHHDKSTVSNCELLSQLLQRPSESIRDRIKKYLTKIKTTDKKKIELAAKVR